ncbi:hypothetical protein J6590_035417 [Homalodisca vitripennis]|nr:hypothetical protein J6590_035417 [Homalodisca vitripennis]
MSVRDRQSCEIAVFSACSRRPSTVDLQIPAADIRHVCCYSNCTSVTVTAPLSLLRNTSQFGFDRLHFLADAVVPIGSAESLRRVRILCNFTGRKWHKMCSFRRLGTVQRPKNTMVAGTVPQKCLPTQHNLEALFSTRIALL